jgi:hypothetical protein
MHRGIILETNRINPLKTVGVGIAEDKYGVLRFVELFSISPADELIQTVFPDKVEPPVEEPADKPAEEPTESPIEEEPPVFDPDPEDVVEDIVVDEIVDDPDDGLEYVDDLIDITDTPDITSDADVDLKIGDTVFTPVDDGYVVSVPGDPASSLPKMVGASLSLAFPTRPLWKSSPR